MEKLYVGKELYEKLSPYLKQNEIAVDPQLNELELADIPADTKKLIAIEYARLCKLHPDWKVHKAMRKAGEKYSVKFDFE